MLPPVARAIEDHSLPQLSALRTTHMGRACRSLLPSFAPTARGRRVLAVKRLGRGQCRATGIGDSRRVQCRGIGRIGCGRCHRGTETDMCGWQARERKKARQCYLRAVFFADSSVGANRQVLCFCCLMARTMPHIFQACKRLLSIVRPSLTRSASPCFDTASVRAIPSGSRQWT